MFFVAVLFFSFNSTAQRVWEGQYNRLGLQVGANHFNIHTNELAVTGKTSWTAGFTARASFYNDFQFVYGINFFDFNVDMTGREKLAQDSPFEAIPYNMIGVQANFFGSYKLYSHYVSVEAGPVLQVNGKLEPRQDKELSYVGNYNVQAIDIENVSPVNVNLAVGLSGGLESFKLGVQYQYGINNFLNPLNDEGLDEKDGSLPNFKGNMSLIVATLTMYL